MSLIYYTRDAVLGDICQNPGSSLNDISRRTGLNKADVWVVIHYLERDGLLRVYSEIERTGARGIRYIEKYKTLPKAIVVEKGDG